MASSKKVALVMGVANQRSIAWSCAESFLDQGWQVVLTYQNDRTRQKLEPLLQKNGYNDNDNDGASNSNSNSNSNILGAFKCDVSKDDMAADFSQQLADTLQDARLSSIVHSLAHAPDLRTTPLLQTPLDAYLQAHEISAYSLIEIARETQGLMLEQQQQHQEQEGGSSCTTCSNSITALSYLGAVRAIPGYHVMGPAKASLEAIVRGLAVELGSISTLNNNRTRVNAVSAGPISTVSAKGGIANFDRMLQDVKSRAPLGNVTAQQVASTVTFLATQGTGITGQTIYVDGGYSIVGGPAI